jgi:O-antigen/teichoic acid export membrane protein
MPSLRPQQKKLLKLLLSGSVIFFLLSGFTSVLNYLYYPVLGRLVSVAEYGEIQFLVSLFTQFAVGFVVLNLLAIIISAQTTDGPARAYAINRLTRIATIVTLGLVVIGLTGIFLGSEFFTLSSPLAIIALGLSLLVNTPFTILIGRLQGEGRFAAAGTVGLMGALLKLVCSSVLVVTGLGVFGAIAGMGIGTLLAYICGELYRKKLALSSKNESSETEFPITAFMSTYGIVAFVSVLYITLLTTIDVAAARVSLNSEEAGQYAALATLSKTLLALSTPVMWLAIPYAVSGTWRQVLKFLAVTAGLVVTAAIFFLLSGSTLVTLLTGILPADQIVHLPLALAAMSACSIAFLVLMCMLGSGALRLATVSFMAALTITIGCVILGAETLITASLHAQLWSAATIILMGAALALPERHWILTRRPVTL